MEKLKIELNEEEQSLLEELNSLTEKLKDINPEKLNENMLEVIKNEAINSIGQSLGITDLLEYHPTGGSILSKGASNFVSLKKRREKYDRARMTGGTFNENIAEMANQAGKNKSTGAREHYNDCYTEAELVGGDVDKGKFDYEHVISAKELDQDVWAGILCSEDEIREFANSEANLKVTNSSLNRSKSDKTFEEFEKSWDQPSKQDPSKTNAEVWGLDKEKARKTYKEARTKYRKTVWSSAGNMAKNVGGYALKKTVWELTRIVISELIDEFKIKCIDPLKERMSRVLDKIKKQLHILLTTFKEAVTDNFISIFIEAALGFFVKTSKNIFKIIRQLIRPIFTAFKTIVSPSSDVAMEERLSSAVKIVGGALVGVVGICLDEVINKGIFTVPLLAPFANYISPVLSSLIVGLGSVMLLQLFQREKNNMEFRNARMTKVKTESKLLNINIAKAKMSDIEADDSLMFTLDVFAEVRTIAKSCDEYMMIAYSRIQDLNEESRVLQQSTRNNLNDVDQLLLELNNIQNG